MHKYFLGEVDVNQNVYSDDAYKITAGQILKYLLKNSNSRETLEGIAEWWIESQFIEESVELVSNALSYLCAQGVIKENREVGQKARYMLNCMPDEGDAFLNILEYEKSSETIYFDKKSMC